MRALALVALVACADTAPRVRPPTPKRLTDSITRVLLDAVAKKDVVAIASALHAPLQYEGLWFADADCAAKYAKPSTIDADGLPSFAACLATLPLHASKRYHVLASVAVLEYDPGVEIEVEYTFTKTHAWVARIGYAGPFAADRPPTLAPELFESHRVAGDRAVPGTDPTDSAWLDVCVGADGAVTTVRALEASSFAARDTYVRLAQQWRFRPFVLATSPSPVCALERLSASPSKSSELLPLDISGTDAPLFVTPAALHMTHGSKAMFPRDTDKIRFQQEGGGVLIAAFAICIDATGAPTHVTMLHSSGLPNYDFDIAHGMAQWRFQPMMNNGQAVPVCSAFTFIYHQS